MSDQPRPVWLTEEELNEPAEWVRSLAWVRYNESPADSAEAVLNAMRPFVDIDAVTEEEIVAILTALGMSERES